jgi:hypothetical protein
MRLFTNRFVCWALPPRCTLTVPESDVGSLIPSWTKTHELFLTHEGTIQAIEALSRSSIGNAQYSY